VYFRYTVERTVIYSAPIYSFNSIMQTAMQEPLTSKQVARALQVSESSIKRWCDKGVLPVAYTAGGHRRIPLSGLIDFLRSSKHELAKPEVLGLPATTGQTVRVLDRAASQMSEALLRGDDEGCRRIVLDLYLAQHAVSRICDEVFSKAFDEIGQRWENGDAEVYQERRGCMIVLRVLNELRTLLPTPAADAPTAIGGAPEGDPYNLGTTMAELVLREEGWNANSLGNNLPFGTLAAAIKENGPRLFWISASHIDNDGDFLNGYQNLYDSFGGDVAFVVGGRALVAEIRQKMKYAAYCDNLQHLEHIRDPCPGNDYVLIYLCGTDVIKSWRECPSGLPQTFP
jgi:excisionase family DNA binding protein